MTTILENLQCLSAKRRKSESLSLSPEDQLVYDDYLSRRRRRVREMIESGRVIQGGATQINEINKRERNAQIAEASQKVEEE
jgi:hypothetical protein